MKLVDNKKVCCRKPVALSAIVPGCGMSDYRNSVTIPLNLAASYWKAVDYGALTILFLLRSTNPIFKIALALHVGMQMMLVLAYSPLVYYKSTNTVDDDSSLKGLIPKLTGFIPNLIKKVSGLVLQIILKSLRVLKICDFKVNFQCLASVVTYFLIIFRKLVALMVFIYVTSEDDESTHKKAFALFSIFMAIQMKYILELNKDVKDDKTLISQNHSATSFFKTVKLLYRFQPLKVSNPSKKAVFSTLRLVRSRLYYAGLGLFFLLFYHIIQNVTELLDNDFLWMLGMKTLIAVDALFVTTLIFELSDLNLHFRKKEDTIV